MDRGLNDAAWLRRMVSHNIRMPMAIICGYAELLQCGAIETEQEKLECLEKITQNIRYLSNMVGLLIDDNVSREMPYTLQNMDLLKSVTEIVGYICNEISGRGIQVTIQTKEKSIPMYGDSVHIMGMIFQLMENALKYLKAGNQIVLQLERAEDGAVLFAYRDNGPGMDNREVPHICEPGYRGSNSAYVIGSGMGMTYVRDVVDKHGGTIAISSGVNQGMQITMHFPPMCSNL